MEQREVRLDDLPDDVKKLIIEYLDWNELVAMEKSLGGRWAELALKKARERYAEMVERNERYELLLTRLEELLELSQAVRRRKQRRR